MLVNSGAEAVENGVKIARKYTGRNGVAVLEHAYHGRTNLTMAMNFKAAPYATGFGPFAGDVYRAPNSYPLHDGLIGRRGRRAHHRATSRRPSAPPTSPASSSSRSRARAASWCPPTATCPRCRSGAPPTASCSSPTRSRAAWPAPARTSRASTSGSCPTWCCRAKGIAGGLPLAGVTGRAEIMDASQPGGLGGTFGGNPVACAAAIAVFEHIERDDLLAEATRIEGVLKPALLALQKKYPIIAEVRGIGAMIAIEFTDPATHEPRADVARQGRRVRRPAGRAGADGGHLRQRACASCRAWPSPTRS